MCFSATASFVAGTALSAAGAATLRMASRRAEIPFAMIPLLFGAHQLTEGMVWLSFRSGSHLPNGTLTLVYSMISHVFWPVYIPFAVGLLETDPSRRKALVACQVAGVVVGLYLLYLVVQFPVTSRVLDNHIAYESPHVYRLPLMLLYLVATCASSLASSSRIIQVFGALTLAAFIAAYLIHAATFFSVWCFFAALLSLIVYCYFWHVRSRALL